ncbi:class I SAM-dependent methyltransferase [Amycolatopsis nigrescens]|uniref:methyltransferase domain-containing protein n=1 Tax=Amycolatopsis nigrescens TaxID=381445 RepID=UPI0003692559|nr:class I SAM-dependent methyltransferase [Amycolatopsis nigrescens]
MSEFDTALLGNRCWLELATGERIELTHDRWIRPPAGADGLLLDRCAGPTLDVGCGPGRLTAALTTRGVAALGIDTSPTAVRLTRQRGAAALHRDVFGPVPGEGRWRHVLLADGNIGIGGDPAALLHRVGELLGSRGTALVELDPPGRGLRRDRVRIRSGAAVPGASWFTWAWLGLDALTEVIGKTALRVRWTTRWEQRWFAELERR